MLVFFFFSSLIDKGERLLDPCVEIQQTEY